MKVVHATSAHDRDDIRIFERMCRSLTSKYTDCVLVVSDGLGPESRNGVRIIDVGRSKGRLSRIFLSSRRVIAAALRESAWVVHLHDPELLPGVSKLARSGAKVIFDAHEDLPRQILTKPYLWLWQRQIMAWILGHYERHVCSKAAAIVAATPAIGEKFGRVHQRTVVINNYPLASMVSQQQGERSLSKIIYVGAINEIRGIRQLVTALDILEGEVTLDLCGSIRTKMLADDLASMDGWRHVRYHGQVSRETAQALMASSGAALLNFLPAPNHLEAQPNKLFEYLAAGVPIVASDFPLWRSILTQRPCGEMMNPLSPPDIARAIKEVLSDKAKNSTLSVNCKLVSKRYLWEREVEKLIGLYESLESPKIG